METIVALFANTNISVKNFTVLVNFATHSIVVKDVSERAFEASSIFPCFAPKIIIDDFEEGGILIFWAVCGLSFRSIDLVVIENLAASKGD